jgi:peroxiredoxin
VELQSQLKDIQGRGLGLAGISYDSPEILAAFSKQRGITFQLLSDFGSATIKKYGLLNPLTEEAFGPHRDDPEVKAEIAKYVSGVGARQEMLGMALPGTLVLDRRGRVTARFFEDFYVERNTVSSLLVKLGGAGTLVAGTKTSTNHLDVTSYASDATVATGNHFSVVLAVTPHPGLHVYAPGAESHGYRVISLKLDPNPLIRAFPVQYPAAEIYYFKPLKERVPVFQKPFRLTQELVLDGSAASQEALRGKTEIAITGALQYQACDEKVCYTPVSLPLSWKVTLRDLIRERPAVAPSK